VEEASRNGSSKAKPSGKKGHALGVHPELEAASSTYVGKAPGTGRTSIGEA
jgi:hypothetical protein